MNDLRNGTSVWQARRPQFPDAPELEGAVRCEVAILGGGITGALVAEELCEAGLEVVLLEQATLGVSSTTASTALLQYEIDKPLAELIPLVGEASAVHAYRRGLEAIDELEAKLSSLDDHCGFRRRESLYFASRPGHLAALEREFECRRHFGFDVRYLSGDQLRERTSLPPLGAILSGGDGQIDPLRLTSALLSRATRCGLRAYQRSAVINVEESPVDVHLETARGRVRATYAVFATGYHQHPFGEPVGTLHSTFVTASQPQLEVPGWPADWLLWETARPYFYARRTDDGRAILGGEDTSCTSDHERDGLVHQKAARLVARFEELFPGIHLEPEFTWAGTFAETPDGLPFLGNPPGRPRSFFALGYGGNGITFSVIGARLIKDLILGRRNRDAEVFGFGRIGPSLLSRR